MFTRTPTTLTLLSLLTVAACSAPAEEDADEANGAQTVAPAGEVTNGIYDLNDGYLAGGLEIKNVTTRSFSFSLTAVQIRGSHNLGDVQGEAVRREGAYVYDDAETGCHLSFLPQGKNVKITESGCQSAVGHNVYLANTYFGRGAAPGKLRAGSYGQLVVAIDGQTVSGRVSDSIGDPAHGGATCTFSFVGKLGADQRSTDITMSDGSETIQGKLLVKDPLNVALSMPSMLSACGRMFPMDQMTSAAGYAFAWDGLDEPTTTGYRVVKAEKAYFHDQPGSAARSAYVVSGDLVRVRKGGTAEWLSVSFMSPEETETEGFIKASDFAF